MKTNFNIYVIKSFFYIKIKFIIYNHIRFAFFLIRDTILKDENQNERRREMKYKLYFKLEEAYLSIGFRTVFLSFIKRSLTEYENGLYFSKFFDGANVKRYCFSVRLPPCVFDKDFIQLSENSWTVSVSTCDTKTGLILYNAFISQKYKPFPLEKGNNMTLTAIQAEMPKPITKSKIVGKMSMPLCIRFHDKETNKDVYYTYQDEKFQETLRFVLINQVRTVLGVEESIFENFSFVPLQMRKTMIRHYGTMIPVSLGTFEMTGHPLLLNYFLDEGVASRRSSGFGTFTVLFERGGD